MYAGQKMYNVQNQYYISVCVRSKPCWESFVFRSRHSSGEILPVDFAFTSSSTYTFFCWWLSNGAVYLFVHTVGHHHSLQNAIRCTSLDSGLWNICVQFRTKKKKSQEKIIINSIASGVNAVNILDSYDRHMEYGWVETFTSFSANYFFLLRRPLTILCKLNTCSTQFRFENNNNCPSIKLIHAFDEKKCGHICREWKFEAMNH